MYFVQQYARDLLEQSLVERKRVGGTVLATLQTSHLKLVRRDLHLLHETAQHQIHQVLVLLVGAHIVDVRNVRNFVGIEN